MIEQPISGTELVDDFRPKDYARIASIDAETIQNLHTKKERVAYVLNRHPETRNSDKLLWLKYLEIFHDLRSNITLLEVVAAGEIPGQNSLARVRAQLQNQYRLYLPTKPEVVIKRQGIRKAYEKVFRHLNDIEIDETLETTIYGDESGLTHKYLLIGFFFTLNGRDSWMLPGETDSWLAEVSPTRKVYFHFTELAPQNLNLAEQFLKRAFDKASARAYLHIFERSKIQGSEAGKYKRCLNVSLIHTVRTLQEQGLIDEGRKIRLMVDASQDQLFYRELENEISTPLLERRIQLLGVEPEDSKVSRSIQVADLICGAFHRAVNGPWGTTNNKDDLSKCLLHVLGVKNPLTSQKLSQLTIVNHGGP
jgi:hypothetical protein